MPATRRKRAPKKPLPKRHRLPDIPVTVAVHEARLLADSTRRYRERFARLPDFDLGLLDGLPQLAAALDERERAWVLSRNDLARAPRAPLRTQAARLRSEMVRSARYLLRAQPEALAGIGRKRNLASLAQDLNGLARIVKKHAAKFAGDPVLPADVVEVARKLAGELCKVPGSHPARIASEARNEAYWALAHAVAEVRAAARYLFRNQPAVLAEMTSGYQGDKQKRRRARRRSAAPAAEKEPGAKG